MDSSFIPIDDGDRYIVAVGVGTLLLSTVLLGLTAAINPQYTILMVIAVVVGVTFVVAALRNPNLVLFVFLGFAPFHLIVFRILETYISATTASMFSIWKDVLLIFGLGVCVLRKRLFRMTRLDALVILFIGYQFLFLVADPNGMTIRGFGNNVRYLIVYLLVRWLSPNLQTQRRLVYLMVGMAGLVAVSGVVLWIIMTPAELGHILGYSKVGNFYAGGAGGFPRAVSILLGANALGRMMGFLLSGLLIWYSITSSLGSRLVQISLIAVSGTSLVLSLSRSSWLGTALALASIAFLYRRFRVSAILLGTSLFLLLAPILMATFAFSDINIEQTPVVQRTLDAFDVKDGSTAVRVNTFPTYMDFILAHPLGAGLGRSSLSEERLERAQPVRSGDVYYSESLYLQLGIETGYLGLGLFVVMAFLVPRTLWRKAHKLSGFKKRICLWALASVVILYVASIVIPALAFSLAPAAYAWTLVAFALGYESKSTIED